MPDRVSHIKRFYGSGEDDDKSWVDVERIDLLVRNGNTENGFQGTVQRIRWDDEGEGNDSSNQTRRMHPVTISNPNGPGSVDVMVIDGCTFSPFTEGNVTRKFRNYEDDNNFARETTSVRVTSDKDTSQYVDVEVVDKFYGNGGDGRVVFKMRNQNLEDNANGPGGPPINPPFRLDPYQTIVGVSWGKKDHHHDTPFSGYPRYLLYYSGGPFKFWFVEANALTLQILKWEMEIGEWWTDTPLHTLAQAIADRLDPNGYNTWGFLYDQSKNQAMLDAMNNAAATYSSNGGEGGASFGG